MRILIAEDDEMVRELFRVFLSDMGHEVQAACNGQELVKLALERLPDLIVTDLHMPEMRGDSMINMIDLYPPLVGIPVIMVTGASDSDLVDASIPHDVPIIRKPADMEKLAAAVRKIAQRKEKQ